MGPNRKPIATMTVTRDLAASHFHPSPPSVRHNYRFSKRLLCCVGLYAFAADISSILFVTVIEFMLCARPSTSITMSFIVISLRLVQKRHRMYKQTIQRYENGRKKNSYMRFSIRPKMVK